jgi:hypothetical protein
MSRFTYDQLSEASIQAVFVRDECKLANFGDKRMRDHHQEQMLGHFKKLATALGFLIEPINADAASSPEAPEAGKRGPEDPAPSSMHRGFAIETQGYLKP